ncbi:hypothetical protein [Paucibacter sp. M5-1]|nr:hypothetical protein [Paucibacter sp. M5-1]MCZ7880065.1 hypothetical protein [Paucibacter sp. M5-1]
MSQAPVDQFSLQAGQPYPAARAGRLEWHRSAAELDGHSQMEEGRQ